MESNYQWTAPGTLTEKERDQMVSAIQKTTLPRFASRIFPTLAREYHKNGNRGLAGEFGRVSVLVDGFGGRMIVTMADKDTKASITFSTADEKPFGLFRNPALSSYFGTLSEFSQMIDTVTHGLRKAAVTGGKPLKNRDVLVQMLGG